jgi:hypothetical protein
MYSYLLYLGIIKKYNNMKNEIGKYEWVLEVIESYEDEDILNDFKDEFEEGMDFSFDEYCDFCSRYVDDCSEGYYIRKNWEYIISEGDVSVFDEDNEDKWEEEE